MAVLRHVLRSQAVAGLLTGPPAQGGNVLSAITQLKKAPRRPLSHFPSCVNLSDNL